MDEIDAVSTFSDIDPKQLDEFKAVAGEVLAIVRTEEGTLQSDWFFDESEGTCRVLSRYADQDAMMAHFANVLPLLERLTSLCGAFSVDGHSDHEPRPDVAEAAAMMGARLFRTYQRRNEPV